MFQKMIVSAVFFHLQDEDCHKHTHTNPKINFLIRSVCVHKIFIARMFK